ncbi:AAA family ATPase [Pseudomonas crudilactis]|uniref:AAA family ATPase n=1 Tax=Pseudomonas crudilactis TaxID=2697028 RepID=UPI0015DB0438|nr:AAA family ATPase [Pseudomonas crudilactis]
MLVGCLVRGYKTYSNVNFIPLIKEGQHKLSIFIGDNGAGKSSVLEAIDVCFNNREWNYNIGSKRSESFICPVFLIKKSECKISNKALALVSDYFWQYQIPSAPSVVAYEGMEKLIEFREHIKSWAHPSDYYFISVGVDSDRGTYFTSTLDTTIRTRFKTKGVSYSDLDDLKEQIFDAYRYIYIPVEITTKEVLDIQSLEFQGLMDKNLISEIEAILKSPRNGASIVDEINSKLDVFLKEINEVLSEDSYTYSTPVIGQKKVYAADIVFSIIESYFSNRTLQKDKKPISALSSGEQRRALIDVAHAFITSSSARQKKLIIAIDEPEASLVNKSSYEQFRRIFEISEQADCQAIIATHWYGLLITSQKAALHHISNDSTKIEIKSFDLMNVHESRRDFPDSVTMKSFFDLVSSMLSIIKSTGGNWIICEGSDDKNYLDKLIDDSIPDLTILPVGGVANVIKLHNYLKIAVEDSSERKLIKGKIFCLIDTDASRIEITGCHKTEEKKILQIKRFQIEGGEARLVEPINNGYYLPTVLEDCLPSVDYFDACKRTIQGIDSSVSMIRNKLSKYAMVNHDMDFLKTDRIRVRNKVKELITNPQNKYIISESYEATITPFWISTVRDFFS